MKRGWQDGPAGEGTCCQACQLTGMRRISYSKLSSDCHITLYQHTHTQGNKKTHEELKSNENKHMNR